MAGDEENESASIATLPNAGAQINQDQIYTVNEAVNKMGFGPFQVLLTVFCGLLWLADAMEFLLLSVLSPAVKCQWNLSTFEEALITSLVFLGFFFGGLVWGVIFDIIGRKRGLLLVNVVILVFGVLSALRLSPDDSRIPGYPWLLICRFGLGFGAGGAGQSITYYLEFLPVKGRGISVLLMEVWWSVGSMLGAVLAIGVMGDGRLGWHWLLGLATIPIALVFCMFPLVPESARFYLVKGKNAKAQKVIERIAWMNCKKVPPGRVVSQEEKDNVTAEQNKVLYSRETVTILSEMSNVTSYDVSGDQGQDGSALEQQNHTDHIMESDKNEDIHVATSDDGIGFAKNDSESDETPLLTAGDNTTPQTPQTSKLWKLVRLAWSKASILFDNGMWKTTLILQFIWFGIAWLYYGIVLLTTALLQYDPHCSSDMVSNISNLSCEENQLGTGDYVKILWASAAELPGLLVTAVIIELLGRKLTMAIEFIVIMIGFLLLLICVSDNLLTFFLFLIRAFTAGLFQAVYVYTPEVYPTSIRAVAMGVCSSSARIGGILTPYVAQVLLHVNDYLTIALYASTCLVCAVLAMLLPIETKGRALSDVK